MSEPKETASQRMASEVAALIRARNSLIVVVTQEEMRAERIVREALKSFDPPYALRLWDCATGVSDMTGKEVAPGKECIAPDKVLKAIRESAAREVWILRDFHAFLGNPLVCRGVRSLARSLSVCKKEEARVLVVTTPTDKLPPELVDHAVVLKVALPDRDEIAEILDAVTAKEPEAAKNGTREAAIEAAVGLSAEAVKRTFAKSMITQGKKILPSLVSAEKKSVVSARGVDWYDPIPGGLDAVGGLENLKAWLGQRKHAFSAKARAFGLPKPKGALIVGIPGTGKSLTAKAIATAWGVPLLRFDSGAQKSKYVGESEANARAAYATADAVGRCVLWFDEIEKTLGGGDGAHDGGVSQDALGVFLTWMQEKKSDVFVVATANDVSKLPAEVLRKGRFDEMFFVDLPTQREREEILRVALKRFGRDPAGFPVGHIADVARACKHFTGAEIADSVVPDALYAAFNDGERAVTAGDLLASAKSVVPLAATAAEKIKGLRDWAKSRARRASAEEAVEAAAPEGGRDLDFGGDPDAN